MNGCAPGGPSDCKRNVAASRAGCVGKYAPRRGDSPGTEIVRASLHSRSPYSFILRCSMARERPRAEAVCETLPPCRRNASAMKLASNSARAWRRPVDTSCGAVAVGGAASVTPEGGDTSRGER